MQITCFPRHAARSRTEALRKEMSHLLFLFDSQGQKPESMNLIDVCEVYEIVELCIEMDKTMRYARNAS